MEQFQCVLMKRLTLFGAVALACFAFVHVHGQVYGPRGRYGTARLPAQPQSRGYPATHAQTNGPSHSVATNPPAQLTAPAQQRTVVTQYVVRVPPPPVDPEKAKAQKADLLRRTIEFQRQRADEGSESAQFELGLRYLKGDGVEKDEETGRKWLQLSAKNGYGPATLKLEELQRQKEKSDK